MLVIMKGSPCEHCGACVKAPRQHPAKCTVLWQICLMHLKLASVRICQVWISFRKYSAPSWTHNSERWTGRTRRGKPKNNRPLCKEAKHRERSKARGSRGSRPDNPGAKVEERVGTRTPGRTQPELPHQGAGPAGPSTGNSTKDPTPGLQLGPVHSAGQPRPCHCSFQPRRNGRNPRRRAPPRQHYEQCSSAAYSRCYTRA